MQELPLNDTDRFRLLPANPTFAGHQTFAVRSGWLKKGMDLLQGKWESSGDVFGSDDALVLLGVGKNMVQSIRHWLVVARMARDVSTPGGRRLEPTALGLSLFGSRASRAEGWDPFLEDPATPWLIHWQLAGPGSLAFTWAWTFSCFREYEFSRQSLADALLKALEGRAPRMPSQETVGRDVDCLLHTYARDRDAGDEDSLDCPLTELGLIRPSIDRHYAFTIGPKPSLPHSLFYYAATAYWRSCHPGSSTISVHELAYAEGSPGIVFKLDMDSILAYLDGIGDATNGLLSFADTPLIQQVGLTGESSPDPATFLQRHYYGNDR